MSEEPSIAVNYEKLAADFWQDVKMRLPGLDWQVDEFRDKLKSKPGDMEASILHLPPESVAQAIRSGQVNRPPDSGDNLEFLVKSALEASDVVAVSRG